MSGLAFGSVPGGQHLGLSIRRESGFQIPLALQATKKIEAGVLVVTASRTELSPPSIGVKSCRAKLYVPGLAASTPHPVPTVAHHRLHEGQRNPGDRGLCRGNGAEAVQQLGLPTGSGRRLRQLNSTSALVLRDPDQSTQ